MFLGLLKSWTRTTSFIGKELVEVIRRPGVLISLILGPFIIMGLFGLGYNGQYKPLNTIVVVPADSGLPADASYYQQYTGGSVNIVQVTQDADAAHAALVAQQVDLVVIAPANIQQTIQSNQQATITIEYNDLDPVRANYARFIADSQVQQLNQAIIASMVTSGQQYLLQTTGTQPIPISPQVAAAPTRAVEQNVAPITPAVIAFFAPAVLALVLQHMAVTLTALSLVRERLSGVMDIFRVAPLSSVELLIGKYLAYGFLNLAIAAAVVFLMVGFLHIPLLGDPRQVALVIVLLTFASLGLGLFISSIVDSERQAVQLSMLLLLASVFFSGFVLPLDEFTTWMRDAAYILPVTHGIQLLQDYMLRGTSNETWELWALGVIGAVLFVLTSLGVRRSMATAS
jgi:ABC-2 type transport system permease protein